MSETVIRVENLSKLYKIGKREEYHTLRDSIARSFSNSFRLLTRSSSSKDSKLSALSSPPSAETIWALKGASFEIKRGEVIGIIGRNGAGKTTLLKILSRITEPTEGYAEIRGRVGSLLEVGTGFHAELTGRENIFLNGAILGMKKAEIERKFDEIVAFAEVEKFIDTPVKHYSSGMYVRLAFAVAAHLEPEILLVDEVLAVGDVGFQKKCLGKMEDIGKEGRTVLFVSHNMGAISNLCKRAILLDKGLITNSGNVHVVVNSYLDTSFEPGGEALRQESVNNFGNDVHLRRVRVLDSCGETKIHHGLQEGVTLEIEYSISRAIRGMIVFFRLENNNQCCVLTSTDVDQNPESIDQIRKPGNYIARCHIFPQYLRPGKYLADIDCGIPSVRWLDRWPRAIVFEVIDTGSVESQISHGREGVIAPILPWETQVNSF
jgi:lipopolysaccharide transport system ATP-binding protein